VEPVITGTDTLTDPVVGEVSAPAKQGPGVSRSPTRIAIERLRKDKVAMVCLGIFAFFVLVAIFAPLLSSLEGQDPNAYHFDLVDKRTSFPYAGASAEHWFGVEPRIGRDLFARWVYGARPSLLVASLVTVVTTILGVVIGLISGFFGGWVDRFFSWIVDFILSLPYLIFAIAFPAVIISVLYGGSEGTTPEQVARVRFVSLILVLSFFGWAGLARLIRGQVLSLREREFISAARVLGVPTRRVLFRELLPNLVAPIVVSASLALPGYIVAEAGLTFLGVGLMDPTPSWGVTIASAQNYYDSYPLYLWVPVLGITILVLALSLLGDAVRDAFDPKTRR
jgi:ABC-type dipeptide/oligopeptide/nickel transport system permease subunit